MLDNDQLEALIARCALCDQDALKELYDAVSPHLNGVAYRIVRSDALSNEVLQEAFVQVWTNAGQYRSHLAQPMTWLCSIVRYRAIDKLKSESRHQQRPENDIEEDFLVNMPSLDDPENEHHKGQLSQQINTCMGELSDNIKQSITLAYVYGYSREELAIKFETSVNTVKSWLHRGSERLRKCLMTTMEEPQL